MEAKEGGNGIVKFVGNRAPKVLKRNPSPEKGERFWREIEIPSQH